MTSFDVKKIREQFPILKRTVRNGKPLVYLDNGATSLKPQSVVDRINLYYANETANIHRAVHYLGEKATEDYEAVRQKVADFVGVDNTDQIVFTSGTTAAINLVARSFVARALKPGDEILISHMEHHANIVPWQMICEEKGAKLVAVAIDDIKNKISPKTKFISIIHISNVLGVINPVDEICALAKKHNVPILIDGAQAVCHERVNLKKLDPDFYTFSAHKICGPTGVGVLYGKKSHLDAMPPFMGGGDMIKTVSFEKTVYAETPAKFEAGTPHIAGVLGLGAAVDFLQSLDFEGLKKYESTLMLYAFEKLHSEKSLKLVGDNTENRIPLFSFVIDGIHAHDLGTLLDQEGIAVRTGHHCAQPLLEMYKLTATTRASFAFYNTIEEVDALIAGIGKAKKIFES